VQLGLGLLIQDVSQEYAQSGHMLELLRFGLIVWYHLILQIGDDGVSPTQ